MKPTAIFVVAALATVCGAAAQTTKPPVNPQDASVVRLYTFQGLQGDAVPNAAGDGDAPLTYQAAPLPGVPPEKVRVVSGHRPAGRAVRLDQGFFAASAPDLPGRAFTAILWFNKHGQGAHRGNSGATNGMLMAVGTGYYDGWRVTTDYPDRTLGFEIGRPQGSVGVRTATAVSDDTWHQLAAVWDGREMRLSIDGAPMAAGEYSGPYTPSQGGALHIGFADSGVGSVAMDVDKMVFYRRALSSAEIFLDACSDTPLSGAQAAQWAAADDAAARKDYASAEKSLTSLLRTPALGSDVAAALRLNLGDMLAAQGKPALASEEYARIVRSPSRLSRQASERLSALLEQNEGPPLPQSLYEMLLSRPGLRPEDRLALRLKLGHSLTGLGKYRAARAQYARAANDPGATPEWRRVAWESAARASIRAGEWAAAEDAYKRARNVSGLLSDTRTEFDERLREVARLRTGRSALDPGAGRVHLLPRPTPGLTLWVAPGGKDTNSGTRKSPLGSLEGARDAIRARRKNGKLPVGGVAVQIRGGLYPVKSTFMLAAEDSGTAAAPVVYRAAEGETPRFDAGAKITGFTPVRDAAVLARLPAETRNKVVQADLRAQGITNFGVFSPGGFASARGFQTHPLLELFFNGDAMPLAGWPDIGEKTDAVGHNGAGSPTTLNGYTVVAGTGGDTPDSFSYSGDRPQRWIGEKDAWLHGYWSYEWADSYEKIKSIDPARKTITLGPPATHYGKPSIVPGHRYRAVNVLSEIDHPGEWYLDRDTGILYFYPPSDPETADVHLSMLESPVLDMEQVSHVTFQGLTWENGRGDGVILRGGESCLLAGCTIRQFGGNGVQIDGGARHGLLGCDITMLGRGGTIITGGDRKTLTPGGHFVENCDIGHFSRIDHTYTPAVLLSGVGDRIAHNFIHDSSSSALRIEGNDHLVEFNDIQHVLLASDDQGASDMFANPTYQGNVFRYNYWHDIGNGDGWMTAGIRLDDWISGVEIYGNVFERCSDGGFGAIQINQGTDNVIENNVFFQCRAAISGGAASAERWKTTLTGTMVSGFLKEVNATAPPYSVRYPALRHIGEVPTTKVWSNVVLDCPEFLRSSQNKDLVDNTVTTTNPGFTDPKRHDFTIRKNSPLWNHLTFQPIPFGQIGLYRDKNRHSLHAGSSGHSPNLSGDLK